MIIVDQFPGFIFQPLNATSSDFEPFEQSADTLLDAAAEADGVHALYVVSTERPQSKKNITKIKKPLAPNDRNRQIKNFIGLIDDSEKGKEIRTFFERYSDIFKKRITYGNPFLIREAFQIRDDESELKRLITEVAYHILLVLNANEFLAKDELQVTCWKGVHHYVFNAMEIAEDDVTPRAEACESLTAYITTLRIVHEIRRAHITFPKTSETEAKEDFDRLVAYCSNKNNSLVTLTLSSRIGKKAADCYTEELRNKASILDSKKVSKGLNPPKISPYDILCGDKPNGLATIVRYVVGNVYKKNADTILTNDHIFYQINREFRVGQFSPTLVFDIIDGLEKKYKIKFKDDAMLDDCMGYCGRYVAALAHPGISTYTAVDPNPELATCFEQIREAYDPQHKKQVYFHCKKIEDATVQELAQFEKQITYRLILTSPPYGTEHYFHGQTNYGKMENVNQLFAGLLKSGSLLSEGGFMVINLANVAGRPLADLFQKYIVDHQSKTGLKWLDTVSIGSRGRFGQNLNREKLIIARKEC